ncbi:hypothetical protein B0H13DRAFT_2451786 [Mycena leptocephala]|nr:hypothetical protein B0H13DRAFT_2451786 [Mycena leptocephala]
MSSPSIAFLPFIPGDQPLSNGVSAIPDLDDAILGYAFHAEDAQDASSDLLDASTNTPALSALFSKTDLSMESVEDIFADLHAVCAYQAPFDPLVLPSAPFHPWDPADVADTPPSVSLRRLTDAKNLDPEEGCQMLDQVDMRFHAVKLVGAAHEDDGSDSDDSDSEEEEVFEPLDGDVREDANTDVQDTVDFDEASLCPSPVRSMCPLPGRLLLQPSPSSSTRRGQRVSAASASPSPAPSLSKPRVKAKAKDTTAASATASTSGVGNSKKRKAKRAGGPRASKQRAVVHSDTSSRHPDIPIIPGINEDGLPAPPNSANVPPKFHFLLRTGFTLYGRGMKCYDPDCERVTGNYADAMRHFKKHFRLLCSAFCEGCPRSFSRDDAARRHMLSMKKDDPGHCSSARRAFLVTFNELPVVVEKRANCNWNDTMAIATMDNALVELFDNLFASIRL